MTKTNYKVRATKSGKFWALDVIGLGWTQALNSKQIPAMVEEFIFIHTNERNANFEVEIVLPEGVQDLLNQAQELQTKELALRSEAATTRKKAATELARTGLTLREIGEVMNISYQRASQLVDSSPNK
ncbi:MAG: hypothetical protein KF916_01120 [Microbacteriaceae bacterium]|nr:hypothetical protein [Microbacteriaceae bacterium]